MLLKWGVDNEVQRRVGSDVLAGRLLLEQQRHVLSKLPLEPQTEGRKGTLAVTNWTLWLRFLFLPQTGNLIALNK